MAVRYNENKTYLNVTQLDTLQRRQTTIFLLIPNLPYSLLISNHPSRVSHVFYYPHYIGGVNESIPPSQVLDHRLRQGLMNLQANQMRSEPMATCPIMWGADM